MKQSKSKILFISITAAFVAFICVLVLLLNINSMKKKTIIAFYRLPENQVELIKSELSRLTDSKEKPLNYVFVQLDNTKPLAGQIKKSFDVVYTLNGKNAAEAAARIKPKKQADIFPSEEILKGATISVKQSALSDGLVKCVPVMLDIYALDMKNSLFASNASKLNSWSTFTSSVQALSSGMETPFAYAGNDTTSLINLLGVLTESIEGRDIYKDKAAYLAKIYENDSYRTAFDIEAMQDLFKKELALLNHWKASGLITTATTNLTVPQLEHMMSKDQVAAAFLKLSDHRSMQHQTVQQFSFIPELTDEALPYFPAELNIGVRSFVAPVTVAVPLSKDKWGLHGITHMLLPSVQETVARSTGLGPVLASCRTPDIQSDDVRYWIAATGEPLVPYSELCFTSDEQRYHFNTLITNCF